MLDRYVETGTDLNKLLKQNNIAACIKSLSEIDEEEASWLIPGWMPEGQITLLAADGGTGKTTLWCNILAAISSGKPCVLDPPDIERDPMRVAFMTTEDSVKKMLRKKLRLAGANLDKIITPDFSADTNGFLRGMKFGSEDIEFFIRQTSPALCVFDPVQGFIPPDINMGSRNAMRDCMAPLVALGEETGTSFLVVCHTNKRQKAYGRDRIADSADLWDISRSVMMMGFTDQDGVRYLSNEKNNYTRLQESQLFSITEAGLIVPEGTTWKRDREFTQETVAATMPTKCDDCKSWIVNLLHRECGAMPTKELETAAANAGYSTRTLRSAKDALKKNGEIKYFQTGSGNERGWHIQLVDYENPFT